MIEEMRTEEMRTSWDRDGYLTLPGFLDKFEMEELNQRLMQFIRDRVPHMSPKHAFYEDSKDLSTLKQMQDLHMYDSFFMNFLNTSRLKKIAQILLGTEVLGKTVEYFNKSARVGKPTPPHQDNYYFMLDPPNAVTMWLSLEKVDIENGCVRYIPGSHLGGMRPHNRSNVLGFSQGIADYGDQDIASEIIMPAESGDLLIHHSMTIHRADGNKSDSRTRKALGLIYFSASATEDLEAKEAYRKTLEQQI